MSLWSRVVMGLAFGLVECLRLIFQLRGCACGGRLVAAFGKACVCRKLRILRV